MNAFSIVGKITDMPILKETSNGLKTCELPIRVLAETVSASCKIGDYVGINGRIHSRKYQKDDRVYLNYGFVAEKVDFLR